MTRKNQRDNIRTIASKRTKQTPAANEAPQQIKKTGAVYRVKVFQVLEAQENGEEEEEEVKTSPKVDETDFRPGDFPKRFKPITVVQRKWVCSLLVSSLSTLMTESLIL